jgi:hypothetical protein
MQKYFPLLHKVVLHYNFTPSFNTWHTPAVSGVVKHLEPLKTLFYFFLFVKFTFLLHSSVIRLLTRRTEKWKCGNSRETEGKIICFVLKSHDLPLSLKEILNFLWSQTNVCIVAEIQNAFSFLWVRTEFAYRSIISSYSRNETSFGKWLNQKAAEVQDTWDGTLHLEDKRWGGWVRPVYIYIYIKHITKKKKSTYIEFYYIQK